MIDPTLGALLGVIITTISSILFAYIQQKKEEKKEENILYVPKIITKRTREINYIFILIAIIFGGFIGYLFGYLINYSSITNVILREGNFIRIENDDAIWYVRPRMLSNEYTPELNDLNNFASTYINSSYMDAINNVAGNDSFLSWPVAPFVNSQYNSNLSQIGIVITALGTNDEWIKISNTVNITVSYETISDIVQIIEITGSGGTGINRISSSPIILTSNYKKAEIDATFIDGDYFTLQPGEMEIFEIPLICSSPGSYKITITVNYSYKGINYISRFSKFPTQLCPLNVVYWSWEIGLGFWNRQEYKWNGSTYIENY